MTRAEAEAEIRTVQRTCRGPLPQGARKIISALLEDGLKKEAQQVDAKHRAFCGADFNEIVLAHPFDGEIHEYECRECGIKGEFRAPKFE